MGNRLAGLRHCLETATQRTRRCGKLLLNARRDLPHDTLRLWDPRSHGEHRQKSATRRSRVAVSHPWHPNDTQGRQGLGSQVLLYDYVVVMEHALPSTTHGLCSAWLYPSRSVGSYGRGHLVSRQVREIAADRATRFPLALGFGTAWKPLRNVRSDAGNCC